MKLNEFEKLKKIIIENLKITEDNAMDKSISLSVFYTNILDIWTKEKFIFKTKNIELDKLYGELYHHYKFKYDYKLDSKNEIDSYIKSDEKYYQIALECSNQSVIIDYLDKTLTHINSISYKIRDYIELKKITKGLI